MAEIIESDKLAYTSMHLIDTINKLFQVVEASQFHEVPPYLYPTVLRTPHLNHGWPQYHALSPL